MSLGDVLFNLTDLEKKTVRRKEKLLKKNIKAKYAIVFNQTCLREHILPAYTNVKLNGQAVAYKQFTKDFRRKFVEKQLEEKLKLINICKRNSRRQKAGTDFLSLMKSPAIRLIRF